MNDPGADRAIIFLHLPKCAGTTLNRLIEWEYPAKEIYSIDPSYFRWSHRKLMRLPSERLARLRVFKGHMPFGLHRRLARPATYITFLRDPVERMISEYYFILQHHLHPQHRQMQKLTLEQHATGTPHHNVQTKLIAGRGDYPDFLAGECNEEILALAKENLAKYFTFAGLTERFDEGLAALKLLFGWNINRYAHFNVTPRLRPKKDKVPVETQSLIAERNKYDVRLYEHVKDAYPAALAPLGDRVGEELESIRSAKVSGRAASAWYLTSSAVRKAISRAYSAI
jgi:Sulfotransferase family